MLDTVRPCYIEHSGETEISLVQRGFDFSKPFFKANQIKGNEKRFNIMGARYIPCSIRPSLTVIMRI